MIYYASINKNKDKSMATLICGKVDFWPNYVTMAK